jgi:phosphate starvation-inducible protein PhoH
MVVTGDTQQADRKENNNGLIDFKRLVGQYENSRYVAGVEFQGRDIHRHAAVVEILKIYGEVYPINIRCSNMLIYAKYI